MKKLLIGGTVVVASVLGLAAPAFAHDCFNPNKRPGAGVHYIFQGVNPDGSPILVQTGQGKGVGGFAAIDPSLTGGFPAPDVHTLGNSSNKEEVGGPGSQKPEHACDGKGIDYIDDCFSGG